MNIDFSKPASFRRKQELEELSHKSHSKRQRYEEAADMLQSLARRSGDPSAQEKALEDSKYFNQKADREEEE
jgi:hypothetical protein